MNSFRYVLIAALLAAGFAGIFASAAMSGEDNPNEPTETVRSGQVVTTMDSGGYTYLEIKMETATIWAAAQPFEVAVGDLVEFKGGIPMTDFHSKTLDRTFPNILFLSSIRVPGRTPAKPAAMPAPAGGMLSAHQPQGGAMANRPPAGHGSMGGGAKPVVAVKAGDVTKAEGGYTVAECFDRIDKLAGKSVIVRGIVVKFSQQIMNRNWVHIQDGTGGEGTNDLTVTTQDVVNTGDTVLVKGVLAKDKDFTMGYQYAVIVEEASVKVEKK